MSDDLGEPTDAAAEAFEGLSGQIEKMMAMLEAAKVSGAVDYSLTLGKIAKSLAVIEAHPAMKMTPTSYQDQLAASVDGVRYRLEGELQKAVTAVRSASSEIQRAMGAKREREAQRNWVLGTCALGFVAGLACYALAIGPSARMLPANWYAPEMLAAQTLNKDFWSAGAQLMQAGNPSGWTAMLEANKLQQRNLPALIACFNAATRTGKAQRCTVMVTADP